MDELPVEMERLPVQPFVLSLDDPQATDIHLVGAKAARLATMRQAGFPVPAGFVVPTHVFRVAPHGEITPDVEAAIETAYAALGEQAVVAVRSSAAQEDGTAASFAGQFDSFLGIVGVAKVVRHIERCWQSVTSQRAQAYYQRAGIEAADVEMAVLVQVLVDAEAAGVLFTLNPYTGAEREMVLEASWGLGEAVVSGDVSPDQYVVEAFAEQILERRIATKRITVRRSSRGTETVALSPAQQTAAVLNDLQLIELVRLGDRVHGHFGAPQDIEWALKDGSWWIVQARPLTAFRFSAIPGQWTSANFREAQPGCATPLSFSLGFAHAYSQAMADFFAQIKLTAGARPDLSPAAQIYGHAYWKTDYVKGRAAEMPTFKERAFDKTIGIIPDYADDGYVPGWTWRSIIRALPVLPALHRQYARVWRVAAAYRAEFLAAEPARRASDPATLDDATLRQRCNEMVELHWHTNQAAITATLFSLQAQDDFHPLLQSLNKTLPADQQIIEGRLMTGLSNLSTAAPLTDLINLALRTRRQPELVRVIGITPASDIRTALSSQSAAGQRLATDLSRYIERYYYLSPCDENLREPRWDEDPSIPLAIFKQFVDGERELELPIRQVLQQHRIREQEEARLEHVLRRGWRRLDPLTGPLLRYHLDIMRRYLHWRENLRDIVGMTWWHCRRVFREQGRRWAASGFLTDEDAIFWLYRAELLQALAGTLPTADAQRIVDERRRIARNFRNWSPPAVLGSFKLFDSPPGTVQAAPVDHEPKTVLYGLPCSPGIVEGPARVLKDIREASSFIAGEILVAPYTNPGWTPLFSLAAAVVTEEGGLLSHGAVVARECGIPAVLQIAGATELIKSGEMLRVDGLAGTVQLLGRQS